jgi:hypothetical protein
MELSIFQTEADKDVNGVWMSIEFRGQVGQFKIARAGNDKFMRIYAKLKNQRVFRKEQEEERVAYEEECLTKAMAEAVLIDTGDEITDQGKPIKYTPEIGFMILSRYPELRNRIAVLASNFEEYATVKVDDIAKNS